MSGGGGSLKDLIPMLIQIQQGKLAERQTAVQEAQLQQLERSQTAAIMDQFSKSLETIRDPSQLNAEINMYSEQFGIPRAALMSRAANYLPTIASLRAGATARGQAQVAGTPQGAALDMSTAVMNLTSQGEGDVAQGRLDSQAIADPTVMTPQVRQASLFKRTGYDPLRFGLSTLIANNPAMLGSMAQIEAGTGLSESQRVGFGLQREGLGIQRTGLAIQREGNVLQRDQMQQQGELARQGLNLQNRGMSLQYAAAMAPYLAAKLKAGQGIGANGLPDAEGMKLFRDFLEMQNAGGTSGLTKEALDRILRRYGEGFNLLPPNTKGTFAPSFWGQLTR